MYPPIHCYVGHRGGVAAVAALSRGLASAVLSGSDISAMAPEVSNGPNADVVASLIHLKGWSATLDSLLERGEEFGQPFDQVGKLIMGELDTGRQNAGFNVAARVSPNDISIS